MLDRSLEDTLPYLFALLGIEEQPSPLQQMDPQIRRRRTFEALKKLFLRESLNQPLILIFEDLHWIDGETQGFLDVLSESVASACLLLLTNYRPEYRHEWGQKTYYTQLRLAPLGREEAEEFLDALLGTTVGARHASPLHQLILEKTEGTPFFMEEVVQELFEQGVLIRTEVGAARRGRPSEPVGWVTTQPTTALQLPPTVQAILAARIDRLALDEKALLQQLSVIGREFPLSLVRHVLTQSEADLYRLLASLQRKEFLYEQPAFPEVEYIFKHALTQEVAYGTVLHERRKGLHERTGQALETMYAATLHEHYSELAHHYQRSDNTEKAVEYLQKAGQQAMQGSVPEQAVTYLTAALQLLETLPDTAERAVQELRLQITLGPALQITKGYGSVEVEHVYSRAHTLCQQVGETPELFPVLWGLGTFYRNRGDLRMSYELDAHCLTLAERVQSQVFFCVAHRSLGLTLSLRGELSAAQRHLEQAIALYDPQQFEPRAFLYGADLRVVCLSVLALVLYARGYPAQALAQSHEALAFARAHPHLLNLAFAECMAAFLHQHRQDLALAQQWAEAAISLSTEHGFRLPEAQGSILRGCALAEQGWTEEGFAQVCHGLANHLAGTDVFRADNLSLLARAYTKAGLQEEGLRTVAEALTVVDKAGSHMYEAELYRIKGELLLIQAGKLRD
ncbi:MAG: hypothetical protein HY267_00105 [Deltaproteobacteria bacterium]|nr:hypothetical protein [Deltaproteobacteria bacterium]